MGTAIIWSGTGESTGFSTATSWSTICGSGTPRAGTTGATSPICSAVCRRTRSCGRGSAKASGRPPRGSSSNNLKSTGWGGGVFQSLSVYFVSLSSSPALAFLCPREEWCNDVARAAATVCCSCLYHERRRRCLRRPSGSSSGVPPAELVHSLQRTKKRGHAHCSSLEPKWLRSVVVVVVVVVVVSDAD